MCMIGLVSGKEINKNRSLSNRIEKPTHYKDKNHQLNAKNVCIKSFVVFISGWHGIISTCY